MDDLDLIEMFKALGYKISWDYSRSDGLHWHEIIDPESNRLVLQIEFGISKESFLKELFKEEDELPAFFLAGDPDSKEYKILESKLYDIQREFEGQ